MDYQSEIRKILEKDIDWNNAEFPLVLSKPLGILVKKTEGVQLDGFMLLKTYDENDWKQEISRLHLDHGDDLKENLDAFLKYNFLYFLETSFQLEELGYEQTNLLYFQRKHDNEKEVSIGIINPKGTHICFWVTQGDYYYMQDAETYDSPVLPSLVYFEKKHMTADSIPFMNEKLRDFLLETEATVK